MISLIIPGEPVSKARPRFSKWSKKAYNTKKTTDYEKLVKDIYMLSEQETIEGEIVAVIECYFKVPKSDSKVTRLAKLSNIARPIKKPDVDNLAKICLDGLNGLAYKDDSQIVDLRIRKWYSNDPRVIINLERVGG